MPSELQPHSFLYWYSVKVTRVVDGDTIDVDWDLGRGIICKDRLRLWGINAPELNRSEQRAAGLAAKAWLEEQLDAVDGVCAIRTHKDRRGKFGRYLAELFIGTRNLNLEMVEQGHAEFYQS